MLSNSGREKREEERGKDTERKVERESRTQDKGAASERRGLVILGSKRRIARLTVREERMKQS